MLPWLLASRAPPSRVWRAAGPLPRALRHDKGHHADADAEDGGEGAAPDAQISEGDAKLERHKWGYLGLMCGNRITSRMDLLLVNNITRRSTPSPSPAVGGKPYSSA